MSHIRIVSSPDPVASWYPFGEKSRPRMGWTWPSSTIAVRPVRVSQIRPIASKPLDGRISLFGEYKWRGGGLRRTQKQPENHLLETLPCTTLLNGPPEVTAPSPFRRPTISTRYRSWHWQYTYLTGGRLLDKRVLRVLRAPTGGIHWRKYAYISGTVCLAERTIPLQRP